MDLLLRESAAHLPNSGYLLSRIVFISLVSIGDIRQGGIGVTQTDSQSDTYTHGGATNRLQSHVSSNPQPPLVLH